MIKQRLRFVEANNNVQIRLNMVKVLKNKCSKEEKVAFEDLTLLMPSVFAMLRVKQSAVHANSWMWETAGT